MVSLASSVAPESSKALRVLVVDDDVDSADIVAHALEMRGHETRAAYEPLEALAVAGEFRPQVAILDVCMPTMGGHELGEALRRDLPGCKFIALTADASALNHLRSQWAGFHDHLMKPVLLSELLAAISETQSSGTFPRTPKVDSLFCDPTGRPRRERTWIYLHESREVVRHWTTVLGCTEAQLRAAVGEVGINSDDVRRHLRK